MELFLQIVGSLLALYVAGVSVMVGSGMAFCRVMRSRMPPDSQQRAVMAAASPTSLGFGVRLVGFGVEVFWQAIALLLQLLHAMGMLAMPKGPADGSPVVLLPGYTESSGNLWLMGRRLARAGYRPFLLAFPSTFTRINVNADFLERELERICQQTGADRLPIVAHSMGGVVTRALVLRGGAHRVAALIAYASPFRGTYMASLGARLRFGLSVRDMAPGSDFLATQPPERPVGVPLLSIISTQEDIVTPEWSSVLPDAEVHVLAAPLGHEAPLFSAQAFAPVLPFLERAGCGPRAVPPGVLDASSPRLEHPSSS